MEFASEAFALTAKAHDGMGYRKSELVFAEGV